MTCDIYLSDDVHRTGRKIVRCRGCERFGLLPPSGKVSDLQLACNGINPNVGPGAELKEIFQALDVSPTTSCQCEAMAQQMNIWGPDGCREHREEILSHLRSAYDEASVLTKLRAGSAAVSQGLPLTLAGLLDLAIERAEGK